MNRKKLFVMNIIQIFIIIISMLLVLTLHLIDNALDYSYKNNHHGFLNCFGYKIHGVFIYDMVLWIILIINFVVISFTLINLLNGVDLK